MNNYTGFYASLADSEKFFRLAVEREKQNGFEFEDTIERKYEEGFVDGMRYAYFALTGNLPDGETSDEIEDETREGLHCLHAHFSTSVQVCSSHGEDADCYERTCDNCNQMMLHVDEV